MDEDSLVLDVNQDGEKREEETLGSSLLAEDSEESLVSISEEEWNRSVLELEEEFEKVRDVKSNARELWVWCSQ